MRNLTWLVFLVACGGKGGDSSKGSATETPKPTPGSGTAVATPGSGSAKPDKPTAKPEKKKLTKEQIAEFRKRMKAGWAKQKDNKWADAVPEFEAALVAAPQDQRALAELGWSAMQAGDFPKARKADEQAVKVAVDKKVKAAALFNLGLVQEKTGDKTGALRSFIASLQLRPNKIVEQAVGRLGATPDKPPPFCDAGAKPCDCVIKHAYDEEQSDQAKCEETKNAKVTTKGFKVFKVTSDAYFGSDWTYVLDEANQLVDVIDGTSERGRTMEHLKLDKLETKTIGGHTVLWIETTYESDYMYSSFDKDTVETSHDETTEVTLCLPSDGKTATRCPLRDVPIHHLDEKDADDGSKPQKTETTVELTLADDGTATVKLVKGSSDEQIAKLVGPHKLW